MNTRKAGTYSQSGKKSEVLLWDFWKKYSFVIRGERVKEGG